MKEYTPSEIDNLQKNLKRIRQAGGWSAEEFGKMIGVTKQTIRNLEKGETNMTKIQYIAIRAILDYELEEKADDKVFVTTVNLCLNADDLTDSKKEQAAAFIEGATKTDLDDQSVKAGLEALVGATAAAAILAPLAGPIGAVGLAGIAGIAGVAGASVPWLRKIMDDESQKGGKHE